MGEFGSLSNPDNWVPFGSLFGVENSKYDYSLHAGVVSMAYRLGFVPLLVMGAIIVPLGWKLHGIYLGVVRGGQHFAAFTTCLGLALFVVPMLGFGSQAVFPVPLFIGLCLGIFSLSKHLSAEAAVREREEDTEEEESDVITLSSNQYAN
jgi:hypothetical protein